MAFELLLTTFELFDDLDFASCVSALDSSLGLKKY